MSVFRVGSNKSSVNNFPSVRPTLDLDFANSKTLDPRITFTRASGGSYVGADGLIKYAGVNEARFDHDPVTGESLGLLIEESRTNLVTYSEQFNDASWIKGNVGVTTNTSATTAPDGTNTAEKLSATAVNGEHFAYKTPSLSSSTYTLSVFAKSAGYNFIGLRIDGLSLQRITLFDLSTGTIGVTSNVTSSSITPYPNGWYRCSITVTDVVINYVFPTFPTNSNVSYTGDGTSGIYIWGAQLEQGSFPTSYIPTVASTRTRAADNASITGKNFSEWYRQDEGTVYADTKINGVQTTRFDRLWAITNANLNVEGISILYSGVSSGSYGFSISVTNSAIEQIGGGIPETAFTTPRLKSVFAIKQNNCAGAVNGQQRVVDSTVDLSLFTTPVDRLLIGQPQRFQGHSCMTISRFTYYPKRLTPSNLQTLTS